MSANICNICGANLIYKDGKWVCPACGAFKTEEISNEEVTLLYNAAQKLRLASFDDAEEAYRDIIAKYPENSEAHWGLVLSKYGIKYEDDYDGKKLPTCYATSIESVLTDKDYLDAVRLCKDKYQKEYYIEQGKVLEKIRVEWLEKASKEPKYDVFLCFKDSDKLNNMERTDDSIEVANLYTHLSSLGYKVFYSRESLRDKVAEKYEPYIYNALNTAAVMIVYGSKIEYFSSVWMKNEWTRYVRRLREGLKIEGSLVIACDGVNPGDLPRPLNQMQVLDARKKTFYGDLEAHIAKIISIARRPKATVERVEISSAIGKKKASIDNQIKTIKVGGGVGKKTPVVIDNAVSVREIGRYEVPALTPDEDTKLKSVNLFLQKELFDNAKKVVDEILEKNKYNGQALLADLLIRYKVKSIDELSDKVVEIEDFSQFNTVIEYNDKDVGEKLIAVIGQKIRLAVANSNYDVAIACLKEIVVYNSTEVLNIRLELRKTATRLLAVSANTAAEIFDVLVNSYQDSETYIEYIQGFVDDCIKNRQFTVAQKYNDKIIELDDGNLKATFSQAYIYVQATSFDNFITLADRFVDFKLFDNAIKHFDEEDTVECFSRFRKIVVGLIASQKSGNAIADWFDFVVKYEFDGRNEFIEETINSLPDIKDLTDRAKLFDRAIMCIDGSDVERHISMRLSFAKKLQVAGNFALANKYYNEVIEIEEGNLDALWGIILCNIGALRETDIAQNIENFSYFKELETLLKYCPDMGIRAEYLDKLVNAVLFKSASICNEESINKLAKIFDGIIKYYPEECNEILIKHLQKFADNCKNSSAFSLAEKYYAMVLAIDNMKHEAYWGLLQAKLNCRNNDDLIKQKKTISEFSEFSSAIAAASNDERSADKYASIAKNQIDYWENQKKKDAAKKKRKKKIAFFSSVTAIVLVIAIALVGVFQYIKIEKNFKFVENESGYTIDVGKYYKESNVEIPATYNGKPVTKISDGMFENDTNITTITLSSNITYIGNNAFKNCPNLKQIIFKSASTYSSASADTHSGSYAITTLAVAISKKDPNNNIAFIGESAFYNCVALESIDVSSATTIGKNAFYGCSKLESVSLNDNLTKLADSTFNGCLKLNDLQLPSALMEIGANCFVNCRALENIAIPATTTTVGANILNGCTGLKKIVLEDRSGDLSGFDKDWKSGISDTVELKVGFRISLDYNGATSGNEAATSIVSVSESYTLPVPKRVGYKFVGWYDGIKDANKLTDENGKSVGAYEKYESISAYAIWEANLNEIVFNANGGEGEMDNQKIATDATVALNECLYTKKGYTFAGWGTTANGEVNYSDKADYMMGTNAQYILYAIWTPNDNTLHFESNGGSGKMSDMTIATDSKATLSANAFTKTGYDFAGWAESENGSKVYSDGDSYTMGTENATLYALWTPKTYKITYNLNGGQLAVENKATYNIETATFTLNNPTKRGYEFNGWSGSNLTGGENQAVSIETGTYGELTFTANWTAIEYSITYNLNEGTNNSANPKTYTIEQEVRLQDPERKGYKFSGWTDNGLISNGSIGEKTFTASWEIIDYNIIYNLEGGINDSSNPTKYNVNTPKITLKAPTKLGYKFIEWTNGGIIENGSTGDKSFTAKWEIETYKITYNLDGGTNNKINPATYNVHDNITLAEPTKTGYKFIGWSDNGKIPVNSTGDKVFTANWEIIGYKITYVLNGGTNSELNKDYYNVENEEIILAAPTRAGYTFNGWSDNGRIPAHSTGDKEFVASWTANQNTLKFSANGGNGGEMSDVTLSTDEEYKLPKNALTRYGYTFAGWSTKSDGAVDYKDESVYTMGADSEVTLYAIWSPITYKITYELNGGKAENITEYSIETGEFSLNAPTCAGYTFTGWSGSNLTGEDNLTVTIADGTYGALSFVAHWQANENTLVFDANGGVGSMECQKGLTASTLTLNANAFTRKGYDFDGWSTIKDGEKQYADKSVYVMGTSSTNTLYAVWTPHLNTLILNGNGSTSGSMNNMNIHSGETKALDKNTYEKQGYTFIGWAETANGNVVCTDCANYTMGVEPAVTLYAVWKANEYTISMNPQNDSAVTTQKVTYDESYTLSVPTRVGYTFDGWFTEVGGNGTRLTDADGNSIANWTVADNITVYAKWLGTEGLVYTANGSEYIVSGVSDKTITEAYIPEYYNGKLVTAIGENAFSGCDKLTAVFMENIIETIGKGAFSGCSALTRLVVPFVGESRTAMQEKGLLTYWFGQDSVENAEEIYQFYLNDKGSQSYWAYVPLSLTHIELSDTTRIPYGAFSYMSKLQNVSFDGVSEIEGRAFEYATGISTFDLPDTLKSIGTNAFAHTSIKNIVIPSSVQSIDEGVFAGCKALAEIKIPFVGQNAEATEYNAVLGWLFGQSNYDGMVATTQGSWTSYISAVLRMVEITNASTVSDYAFANIKTLTNVTLANSVTTIGNSAFSGCIGLTSINLECVVSFGNSAFYGTSSLTEVDFSDNLTTIGSSAFYGSRISKIELPDSIVSVGSLAFASNSVLRTIIIRKDGAMLSYASDMLKGFNSYAKIYVPDGLLTSYKSNNGWKALGVDKFYGLSIVKSNGMAINGNTLVQYFGTDESVTIPSSITNILPYAFYRNTFVRRIVIPGTITTITDHAFYGCDNLETVKLMRGTTQILSYAFAENALLQSINLPDTLVSIGASAFDNCDSLQAILLPNNLQTIGDYAFRNTQLSTVIVHNDVNSIGLGAFQGCPLESITLPFVGKTGKTDQTSESVFGYVFGKYGSSASSKPEGTTYQGWRYGYYLTPGTSGYNYAYSSNYCADYYYIPTTLKTVVITDATIIPYGAFQNCDFIENITVPSTVTKISNFAFKNCKGITNINLGTALASIGTYAFADCSALETITIPNTVENIGSYAFNNCSSLSRMNSSTDGNIVLPTEITTVPSYAFAGCVSILSVQLPKNLATIQNNAFENCVGITELTLLNGLESIGDSALRNVSIKTIIVPDSVTSIGLGAFYGCPLESITLPFVGANRDLKTSVDSSYYTEKQLLGYIFGTTLESTSSNGQNLVYQGQSYNSGYRKYYIPSTLKTVTITDATGISANAFYGCTMIESLTLNEGITIIYDRAFYNCTALKSMEIPESVASLGVYAFGGCNGLNSVILPNLTVINDYTFYNCKSLAEITLPTTLTKIGGYAFYGCLSLDELSIPSTVTSIGNNTFDGCSGIAKLVLPENLQTIGESAFRNVPIKTIVVPDTVTSIGLGAFYGCPLESITLPFVGKTGKTDQTSESVFGYIFGKYSPSTTSKPEGTTYQGWGYYGSYIITGTSGYNYAYSSGYRADYYYIPTTLKTVIITNATIIPYGAFQNCDFIENITVPSTVTKISNFAFKNCKGITNINLGTALASIGTYAFADCSSLKTITIPDTVENIGSYAFNNCNLLSRMNSSTDGNIVLPTGIITIPSYAFAGCASILSVQLPKNLATVQNNAFENCVGITELILPNGLESIGDSAFRNVPIKTIVVPDTVTSIGLGAFYGCPLESITLPFVGKTGKTDQTSESVFGYIFGKYSPSTTSKPEGTTYQGWGYYGSYIITGTSGYNYAYSSGYRADYYYIPTTLKTVIITNATIIPYGAFQNCDFIENITVPSTVTKISNFAFKNCKGITNINLGTSLADIGTYAFADCSSLKRITIPDTVENVGSYAFYGCTELECVAMSSLTVINDYTFYNCKSLTEITLPTTLTKIGSYAFYGCSVLTEIVVPDSVTILGNYSFAQCNNLINISLSNDLTSIGNYVFDGCANLSKIALPSTLTNIGTGAFANCSGLRVMEIPESVVAIGDSAFTSCSNLRVLLVRNGDISKLTTLGGNKVFDGATGKGLVVVVPMDAYQAYKTASYWSGYSSRIYSDEYIVNNNSLIVDGTLLQYWGDEKSYTVLDSVRIIGSYAFYGSAVEELKYGTTLEQIKNDAFANCTKLAKINSTENGVFNLNGSLKKIATRAFYNNANATKIIVNSSVETIGYAAFMGCNNLVSIELPFIGADRNSTYSQSQVFGYIFGYETSNKEGTTMQYTNYYYYIPASLREVVITDETVISKNAFINCSMIESIIIKSDLTSISDYAFYNCDGLKTITIESNTMPTISAYVFNGDSTVVIKVNSTILTDYQSDVNWSKRTLEAIQ